VQQIRAIAHSAITTKLRCELAAGALALLELFFVSKKIINATSPKFADVKSNTSMVRSRSDFVNASFWGSNRGHTLEMHELLAITGSS
jgi:hypothetical protein